VLSCDFEGDVQVLRKKQQSIMMPVQKDRKSEMHLYHIQPIGQKAESVVRENKSGFSGAKNL